MVRNNKVINVQIQNGTNDFASALATAGTTLDGLAVSTTGAFDMSNNGLDWNNTTKQWNDSSGNVIDRIRLATKKADGTFYLSDEIEWSKVIKNDRKDYAAAVEQITYVGFNAAASTPDALGHGAPWQRLS